MGTTGGEQDRASFDSYVQRRGSALTRFAYLLVQDHYLAQDLTQEALARLHRHWPRVSTFEDPDSYVRKIMVNQLLSWRRRRWWSEHSSPDPVDQNAISDSSVAGAERDEMWTLLGTLAPQQRAVLVLRFYEDLDDSAIATLLGCSSATVRSHASKALARLRTSTCQLDLTGGEGHD